MGENVQLDTFTGSAPSDKAPPSAGLESESPPPSDEGTPSNTDSKGSDEYGTPRWLIRRLTDEGLFDLDPTSGAEPIPIAKKRFNKRMDALKQSWTGAEINSIWLNPPYSNPEPFLRELKLAVDPDDPDAANYALSLTKADTSTGWFHQHLTEATVLCFLDSRLKFYGGDQGAKFPNVIGVFGEPPKHLLETVADLGELYSRVEVNAAAEQQRLDDLFPDGGTVATAIPVTTGPAAPGISTPQSKYASLDFVSPDDEIELTFDTDSLGSRFRDIPEKVYLSVLPDGKKIDTTTGSILIDTIGKTNEGADVCAQLRNSAEIVSHLEVSLAVGMDHWGLATPKTVAVNP